ncbi:MAG TPA: DUF4864 domain-containing protein [Candidatus Binatia bacterium]|nr:DUF4864 domain-containing protein [Candidatus Binatia bacterium]
MEEPLNPLNLPEEELEAMGPRGPFGWEPRLARERHRRRTLLRRLTAVLGTGTLAFTLSTWLLLRHSAEPAAPHLVTAPTVEQKGGAQHDAVPGDSATSAALRIARAQLVALNGDDIAGAYSYFSPRYRARVSLPLFRKLVMAHRDMFHTDEQDVDSISESEDRVVVDIHVTSDDDEDYVAHYTLVRLRGHWVVDELRWGFDQDEGHSTT